MKFHSLTLHESSSKKKRVFDRSKINKTDENMKENKIKYVYHTSKIDKF